MDLKFLLVFFATLLFKTSYAQNQHSTRVMQIKFLSISFLVFAFSFSINVCAQPEPSDNLQFDSLATRWDEGMPLGNGWLGELIWKKDNKLRISLDRVDLWDDRPMPKIDQLKFKWVVAQLNKGQYDTVHKIGDEPYDNSPAPTKIPGAALEFNYASFGKVISNVLDIKAALSTITFENGVSLNNYVHARDEIGYFDMRGAFGMTGISSRAGCSASQCRVHRPRGLEA